MSGVERFPSNFKWLLENRVWEKPRQFDTGVIFPPCSLCELVTRPYPEGLEVSLETVERLISGRPDVLALWTEIARRPQGQRSDLLYNIQEVPKAPTGTSIGAGLRSLQKAAAEGNEKAAEELAKVVSGEKKVHPACVAAGTRKSTKIDADVKARCSRAVAEWCVSHAGPNDDLSPLVSDLFACGAKGIAIEIKNLIGESIMDRRFK